MHEHEGHRSRMREKFLKNGPEAFLPHELLEMFLFYAIPRCNTNEISHELIKRFGSLRGVFDADYEDLMSVKGIGENAAFLIKFTPNLLRMYLQDEQNNVEYFDKLSVAREFGVSRFLGCQNENLYVLLLDNQLRKIDCIHLKQGTVNHVAFDLTELYRNCINRNAAAVILYHNHPNGLAVPSRDDVEVTYQIEAKLADISVCLLEHFVVSDFSCMPILYTQNSSFMSVIPRGKIDRNKLEHFYCN